MTGAEFIVRMLEHNCVRTVFGYPGGTVLSLYDALYRRRRTLTHIRTAHEQGAAHAADGYARLTGGAGVCIATSGPGATNLVTGIANAFMDSVPVVFITGNVEHTKIGTDSFQEVDIVGMTLGITKHSWAVRSPELLVTAMSDAFRLCLSPRRGPVLIDVAKDILDADNALYADCLARLAASGGNSAGARAGAVESGAGDGDADAGANGICAAAVNQECGRGAAAEVSAEVSAYETAAVCGLLAEAARPLIICGAGVRQSGARAAAALEALAGRLGAPVCHTLLGTGTLSSAHPLNFGLLGKPATGRAGYALERCDLILAVGARLSSRVIDLEQTVGRRRRLVQLDSDRAEINKIVPADAYIVGDACAALEAILARLDAAGDRGRAPWFETALKAAGAEAAAETAASCAAGTVTASAAIDTDAGTAAAAAPDSLAAYGLTARERELTAQARTLFTALRRGAGDNITLVTDVGLHQLYTARCFPFEPGDRFITSGGLGTMGFGLGAAIGAAVASPGRTTLLVTGDGSFMMNMNELATVARLRLPVIVVVMRNDRLGMVHELQQTRCGRRYSETVLRQKLNLRRLAGAFGIKGVKAVDAGALERAVKDAAGSGRAAVIEIKTSL